MAKDNTLKILTHILGLITGFIGPLIILLASEDKHDKEHSKKSLNWQISVAIYSIVSVALMFILIGIPIFIALYILNLIFCIMATVKASNNELWDYPLAIKFLK
jgi:uncharacterized protein